MKQVMQILIILLFGCSFLYSNAENNFQEIHIESRPFGFEYATKTLKANGEILSIHFRNDNQPYTYRGKARLSSEDISKIKILIGKAKTQEYFDLNNITLSYLAVHIILEDGTRIIDYAKEEKGYKFGSDAIQEIWDIINETQTEEQARTPFIFNVENKEVLVK